MKSRIKFDVDSKNQPEIVIENYPYSDDVRDKLVTNLIDVFHNKFFEGSGFFVDERWVNWIKDPHVKYGETKSCSPSEPLEDYKETIRLIPMSRSDIEYFLVHKEDAKCVNCGCQEPHRILSDEEMSMKSGPKRNLKNKKI